jgi:hypothetical protein
MESAAFSIAVFFVLAVPYLILCYLLAGKLKADKEESSANLFLAKQKILRDTVYDAVAYAEEQRGKHTKLGLTMTSEEVLACATGFVLRTLDGIPEERAIDAIESIIGKIPGAGASKNEAVRK